TDVTLVVDRSGSMEQIRSDAQGGINAFVADQAKLPGECRITLVQFDDKYEVVHSGILASQWPEYHLSPRGSTALLDAVGRAIIETGNRISAMPESQRPGLVICVISTDGMENASQEFTREKVREMISHQQTVYNWHFTFLAANQDAFTQAGYLGLSDDEAVVIGIGKVRAAGKVLSNKVERMRGERSAGRAVDNRWSADERKEIE
ncbi:MAG: VWA domain-containing protein, partial [Planctomycetota bacterium]